MSRGLLLGADIPKRPFEIFVPRGLEDEPQPIVGKCLVPGCGATFYRGQEELWQRHVASCATRHIDELRALAPSEANKGTIFDHADRDLDLERHFREVGENMRREGRWDVLPRERTST